MSITDSVEPLIARAELNEFACFVHWNAARARASAARAESVGGPLWPLSLAVKDNIDVRDAPTTAGSPALSPSPARRDAPAVQRLVDAGAWVLAKANMHELAFGVTSRNAAYGFVRNPRAPGRSAGGSSGGCGAAIAAGLVDAALGTDTGGSIRIPAAFCGVVGFRPSTGRYPSDGVVPLARSRDTIGLMAHDVATVSRVDAVLAPGDVMPSGQTTRDSLRIGVPRGFLTEDLDPDVAQRWGEAIEMLRRGRVELVDVDIEGLWDLVDQASPVLTAFELRRDFGELLLTRSVATDAHGFVERIASPDVRRMFEAIVMGDAVPPADSYRRCFTRVLPELRALIARIFEQSGIDAWTFPTTPTPPPSIECDEFVSVNGRDQPLFRTTVRNLQQASLIGMPSLTLPISSAAAALPVGLCIEAPPGDDGRLLQVAAALEPMLLTAPR